MNGRVLLAAAVALIVALGAVWFGMGGREAAVAQETTATTTATTTAAPATTAAAPSATESSVVSKVPDMVLGQADAPVTMIEYASFTCPHCANFHNDVFEQVKKNYIDTGKVRFVYREVYFDKFGLWGAIMARCGGPEKYFGISDILFTKQREWLASGTEQGIADALRTIGLSAGLTDDQIKACMADQDQAKAMVETYQKNATADAIQGTPTFIINGEKLSGEMSFDEMAKVIDAKLAK